jgi:cytochrome c peroxidase
MYRSLLFFLFSALCLSLSCSLAALSQEYQRLKSPLFNRAAGAPPGAAQLGEALFFDPVLSGSGRTACVTCHDPKFGFASRERTSTFDDGRLGPRNAPSILTSQFLPRLMWDGRYGSLEEQLKGPLSSHGEMGSSLGAAAFRLRRDPFYVYRFLDVFGEPPTPQSLSFALAAFERSLVSGWSRFDRFFLRGERRALSPIELRGFEIFTGKARCSLCHRLPEGPAQGYPLFTDFDYHNLGVGFHYGEYTDKGLGAISHRRADLGSFRTPSLRNVAVTAPYMHDGSIDTLEAVVEFYNHGAQPNPLLSPVIRPLGLSAGEKAALVAFLRTLTVEGHATPLGEPGFAFSEPPGCAPGPGIPDEIPPCARYSVH